MDDRHNIVDAFRETWMERMDLAMPLPTLVLGVVVTYWAEHPWWAVACVVLFVVSNFLLSRVSQRVRWIQPDGAARFVVNALAVMGLIVASGPQGHGWVFMVMPSVAAVFAPTLSSRVAAVCLYVVAAVLASWWIGIPSGLLVVVGAVLSSSSYLSLVLYQSIFHVWMQAELRGVQLQEKNAQLQDALAARQEFLATMSHEVRTPLNGVLGMAELLQRTDLDQEQEQMLCTVQQSGLGLLQVLNDILDASRLDAGAVKLERIAYDPAQVVSSVVSLLRPTANPERVQLFVSCTDLPGAVLGDPARLRQVLLNLVGNAVKFTEQGSVSVSVTWSNDVLNVDIVDTGIGISPASLPTLFEPFVQAEAGIARRFGGTGLGLNISHRLVTLMRGHLSVQSEVGVGSRFTVRLPAPAAELRAVVARAKPEALPAFRVLLADDNAVNRLVTERMLTALSCTCVSVGDGAQALAALEMGPFDLVLMDCRMPVMDGLQATRLMRARGVSLPVVALTAGVTEEERAACAEAGMTDVLAKPLTLEALHEALALLATSERASA